MLALYYFFLNIFMGGFCNKLFCNAIVVFFLVTQVFTVIEILQNRQNTYLYRPSACTFNQLR